MEELVGQSLDRYQIMRISHKDDMGTVFVAQDIKLQRDVALKVLDPQLAQEADFENHFLQQARVAARLEHPSIIKVLDFGQAHTWTYIVTELITDETLSQYLTDLQMEKKWLALPEAIQLTLQVCLAVDYMHQAGIMHRRITPRDIALRNETPPKNSEDSLPYRPILTDLGLTKLHQNGLDVIENAMRERLAYMSPEQILGQSLDARSDVYALGILLYLLTAGELPFKPSSFEDAYRYHNSDAPPLLRSLRPDFVEPIEQIILKALSRNPTERYPNVKAMADALLEIRSVQVGLSTRASQPQTATPAPASAALVAVSPTPKPNQPERDSIVVVAPDGAIQRVTVQYQSFTIGREANNEVILDDPRVSRQHTKVQLDGADYRVTDLNSTNGTFMGDVELTPGIPMVWDGEQLLHVGNFQLRLERKSAPSGRTIAMSPTRMRPVGQAGARSGEDLIGAEMDVTNLSVTPGNSVRAVIILHNRGISADQFNISVSGIPTDWFSKPAPVKLPPGEKEQVAITFRPPAVVKNKLGRYPLSIRVSSQTRPDYATEVEATLTIITYTSFSASIEPLIITAGQGGQVMVRNQGSLPETFAVQWWDRSGDLSFEPSRYAFTIPAGQMYPVDFNVLPRKKRMFGGTKEHTFSVQVTSETEDTQTLQGRAISKASVPIWAPIAAVVPVLMLIFLLLIICAGAIFFIARRNSEPAPPAQAVPPIIRNVTIEPPNPAPGEPFVIKWDVDYATVINVEPFAVIVNSEQKELLVPEGVSESTAILFTAENEFGNAERTIIIPIVLPTVTSQAQPVPATPQITALPTNTTPPDQPTATPDSSTQATPSPSVDAPNVVVWSVFPTQITAGQTVVIRWEVTGADSVNITPFGEVGAVGEIQDTPADNQSYTLSASNEANTVERSESVTVSRAAPNAPSITLFEVEPGLIESGEENTVRLTWETEDADAVSIEPDIGLVGLSGFYDVSAPASDQVYTLTARNAQGETQAQVQVVVKAADDAQGSNSAPTQPDQTNAKNPEPTATTVASDRDTKPTPMPTSTLTPTPMLDSPFSTN